MCKYQIQLIASREFNREPFGMAVVRRARPEDARGIHDAHMRSIQQICSKDYSSQEIRAWGGRPFREELWLNAINNHSVWVIEKGEVVCGYGHLIVEEKAEEKVGRLMGLYLTPEVKGQGFGFQVAQLILEEARRSGASFVTLASSLTAHDFYRKLGFVDTGPQSTAEIAGVDIRCFPMKLELNKKPGSFDPGF